MKRKSKNIILVILIIGLFLIMGLSVYYIKNNTVILGIESFILSSFIVYLFMSNFNNKIFKETFESMDKVIIFILSIIILTTGFTLGITMLVNNNEVKIEESNKDRVVLDESNVVSEESINLDKEDTDVTITVGGTYTFSGSFTHSIIVDASDDDVEIVLNGVDINSDRTAAIIGLSAGSIVINLMDDSINKLTDGGNSNYDGCIYSNGELIFTGNGTLYVNGEQNEGEGIATEAQNITFNSGTYIVASNDDGINAGGNGATITFNGGTFYINAGGDGIDSNKDAIINGGTIFVIGSDTGGDAGIDTDDGYVINGGTVIALGSDMIEVPEETSKQKVIAFSLDSVISKDTIITLMKDDEVIVSFEAPKNFKTIIISTDEIDDGEYSLYSGGYNSGTLVNGIYTDGIYTLGNIINVNSNTIFNVSGIINLFGRNR